MTPHVSAPAGRLARLGRHASAIAAGAVLAFGSGAASAVETNFVGSTNGCFGLACVPVFAPGDQSIAFQGLTYNNSTFDATTSSGFLSLGSTGATTPAGNFNNLGSFSLSGDPFTYNGSFSLLVTFTAPPGTAPGSAIFTDVITGSVSANNVGGVFIDFDNTTQHFTFDGGGTFSFFVNDVSLTPGKTIAFSGTIIAQVAAIPEPETYAMFLAGLAALGFMGRRRRR